MHSSVPGPVAGRVTGLLVSHDGERWLPAVIDGLRSQRTPVDRVVAVAALRRDLIDTVERGIRTAEERAGAVV